MCRKLYGRFTPKLEAFLAIFSWKIKLEILKQYYTPTPHLMEQKSAFLWRVPSGQVQKEDICVSLSQLGEVNHEWSRFKLRPITTESCQSISTSHVKTTSSTWISNAMLQPYISQLELTCCRVVWNLKMTSNQTAHFIETKCLD